MRNYISLVLFSTFFISVVNCGGSKKSIEASKGNCTENEINADENVDKYGNPSLVYAVHNGHGGCAAYLIENGSDPNSKDNLGRPVIVTAALNNHEHIVKLLIEKGANVDAVDSEGRTALIYMVLMGNLEGARSLLDANANVNLKDNSGDYPIIYACQNSHSDVEMLKLLVSKGADVNGHGGGNSAMMTAQLRGYTDKAEYLKSIGAVQQAAPAPEPGAATEAESQPGN